MLASFLPTPIHLLIIILGSLYNEIAHLKN